MSAARRRPSGFTAEKNEKQQTSPQRPQRARRKTETTDYWGKTEKTKTTGLTAEAAENAEKNGKDLLRGEAENERMHRSEIRSFPFFTNPPAVSFLCVSPRPLR